MAAKNVRIQDVARAAGVSTATVSRALSNPDLVSETTRDVVFAAVQSTGYRVNKAARNLRLRQSGAVLVLVPNLGNPFFSQILAGLSETLRNSDYSVLIADTQNQSVEDRKLVDYFRDSRVDGMICLDGGVTHEELHQFEVEGVSDRIIFACEWVKGSDLPSVRSDNFQGACLAVEHLCNLGHTKIAHVTGPQSNVLTHVRREGMLEERSRRGLPVREDWIIRGDFSLESGRQAAKKILAMDERPTAVFCASDQVAFGLMSTLVEGGIRVPEDLSVVGFDDIELSEFYVPALTTIRQDRRSLGTRAGALLLERLEKGKEGDMPRSEAVYLPVELVVRASACPPAS